MDLQTYQKNIKNKLMKGLEKKIKIDRKLEDGVATVRLPKNIPSEDKFSKMFKGKNIENKMRKMIKSKVPKIDFGGTPVTVDYDFGMENQKSVPKITSRKPSKQYYAEPSSDTDEDEDEDSDMEVTGGKFNFIKSMKHLGRDIAHSVRKAGIQKIGKEIADVGVNQLKKIGTNLLSTAETVAPEVAEEGAEVAPLAVAAGMKKPRKKRVASQKEKNRHELIRQLMKEYGCTLPEASRYIKENNLRY